MGFCLQVFVYEPTNGQARVRLPTASGAEPLRPPREVVSVGLPGALLCSWGRVHLNLRDLSGC